ncbi:MAG: hypothetical protein QM730_16945 [Anaerolineales bacterium]
MKAELDPAFVALRGSVGNFTYRKIRGKTILSPRPANDRPLTPNQLTQREKFNKAVLYGKSALSDTDVRALYEGEAKERNVPLFSVMIADYFNAPTIHDIDLANYTGHVGSVIRISASDDFCLKSVHVSITNSLSGTLLENGDATETSAGSCDWVYTARFNVPAETLVNIQVVATDLPGGTAVQEETKQL